MQKELKVKSVKNIKEKFEKSKVVILTDYKGLTVAQISRLRGKLRPINAEFKVVKNTLTAIALKEDKEEGLKGLLSGATAILFGFGDQVLPAKVLSDFIKENNSKPSIKGGLLDGKFIDPKVLSMLAKLPAREVLLAKAFGGMKAPITNLVFDLKGIINKFVFALSAIKDKKK